MSLGDTIKQQRLAKGLSPRRLEKLLHVTHGAVAAWESGRVTPTEKNLLRMEELFGCYLGSAPPPPPLQPDTPPREEYRFRLTKDEIKSLRRSEAKTLFLSSFIICAALIALSLIALLCGDLHVTQHGLSTGPVLSISGFIGIICTVKLLIQYLRFSRTWSEAAVRMVQQEYRYRLYEDYVLVDIAGPGREKQTVIEFDRIIHLRRADGHQCVLTDAGAYFLPLDILPVGSFFLTHIPEAQEKPFEQSKQRNLFLGLCGFSIAFIIIGFMLRPERPGIAESHPSELIMNLATLGLAALIGALYTFHVRKRLRNYAIPLAACLAAAVVLFFFSETCFQYNRATEIRSDDSAYRRLMELEDPEPFFSRNHIYTDPIVCGEFAITRALVLEYTPNNGDAVDENLENSPYWLPASKAEVSLPAEMLAEGWDYLLIYSPDNGNYNETLSSGAEYLVASYDCDRDSLMAVEFTVRLE